MKKIVFMILSLALSLNLLGEEKISSIKTSHNDGNVGINSVDNDFKTRWSADNEAWIEFSLEKEIEIKNVDIAFFKGSERKTIFDIEVSKDGKKWEKAFSGEASGATEGFERYPVNLKGKFLRIKGYGNNVNKWNSISEVKINNSDDKIKTVAGNLEAKKIEQANAKDYQIPGDIFWSPKIDKNWRTSWEIMGDKSFGLNENLEIIQDGDDGVFRVRYPKGSIAPSAVSNLGAPLGGAQFYINLEGKEAVELSYMLKFSPDFKFVKGGKLPGLYGGDRNASGKRLPTEDSGFSTRMMWRENGAGYIYAYLPSSEMHGTYLGKWQFEKNKWHKITQRVYLNKPGKADGKIEIYLDRKLVSEIKDLKFRNGSSLTLDGLFFSTFFGGSDKSWASQENVYMDYKNFEMRDVKK